jgi:hypothetical protein
VATTEIYAHVMQNEVSKEAVMVLNMVEDITRRLDGDGSHRPTGARGNT